MPAIEVLQSELQITSAFSARLWALVHDVPSLYDSLLDRLAPFGLSPSDIRTDSGDGTLGGLNVNFWLLNFGALVRVRLESLELNVGRLDRMDPERLSAAFEGLFDAVAGASPKIVATTHAATLSFHATLKDAKSADFLARFVRDVPDGVGPYMGSGCVFYYGPRDQVVASALTLDRSAVYADAVFARTNVTFDGQKVAVAALRRMLSDHLDRLCRLSASRTTHEDMMSILGAGGAIDGKSLAEAARLAALSQGTARREQNGGGEALPRFVAFQPDPTYGHRAFLESGATSGQTTTIALAQAPAPPAWAHAAQLVAPVRERRLSWCRMQLCTGFVPDFPPALGTGVMFGAWGIRIIPAPGYIDIREQPVDSHSAAAVVLRDLVESDQISAARRLLASAHALELGLTAVAEILRPPAVAGSDERDVGRTAEYNRLTVLTSAYQGRWVALVGDEVIADDGSLKALLARLQALAPSRLPIIHFIE